MNQKGHVLLIVILIAAIFGGYLLYSGKINLYKTQVPSAITSPSPTTSDITNWKTYTNTKYGYQLQYPQDWIHSALDKSDKDILDSQCLGKNLSKCILNISILDGNSWERQKQLLGLTLSSKEGTKEISFADTTGLKRIGYFGETGSLYGFVVILNNNGKVYRIWAYQKTEDKIDFTSNIDQILSTFKFLDQSEVDCSNSTYTYRDLNQALKDPNKVCYLDLSNRNLTELPQEMSQFTNLQILYLNNNKIASLPDNIKNLKKLTLIDLTGNPITLNEVDRIRKLLPQTQVLNIQSMNPPQ